MPSCVLCKKKISSMMKEVHTCRCKKIYCGLHLQSHVCTFDYQKDFKDKMKTSKSMISAAPDRITTRV